MKKLNVGPVDIELYDDTTVVRFLKHVWTHGAMTEAAAIHHAHSLLVNETDKFVQAAKAHGYDLADERDGGNF